MVSARQDAEAGRAVGKDPKLASRGTPNSQHWRLREGLAYTYEAEEKERNKAHQEDVHGSRFNPRPKRPQEARHQVRDQLHGGRTIASAALVPELQRSR